MYMYIYIYYRIESPIKIAPKSADDTSEFEDYDDDEVILPSPPHPTTPYPLPTPHSILHVLVPAKCHYLAPHQYLYVEFEYFHSRDLSRASIFPGPFPPSSPLFFPIPSTPSTHTPFSGAGCQRGPRPARPAESVRQVLTQGIFQDYVKN